MKPAKYFSILLSIMAIQGFSAAQSVPETHALDDGRQWLESRGLPAPTAPALIRAAAASARNQTAVSENLLLRIVQSQPASDSAQRAYELLSRIYLRSGRYARLIANLDQWARAFPDDPHLPSEKADVEQFRGLPDQINGPRKASRLRHGAANDFTASLHINGKRATYLLDTGAWMSVMTVAEAKRLGLTIREGTGSLNEPSGKGVAIRTAVASEVVIGSTTFHDVSFAVLPDVEPWRSNECVGGRRNRSLHAEDESAVVTVLDDGPGVPFQLREVIFEPFRQADDSSGAQLRGTGLGLSIAREFLNLHGGTIEVGDASEGGALFKVLLPRVAPEGTKLETGKDRAEAMDQRARGSIDELRTGCESSPNITPGSSLTSQDQSKLSTVLIIEDNVEMNRFIAEALSSSQYRVESAFDGREGLRRACALRPDLIISDVMMPKISGEQLLKELRQNFDLDGTPILILTARAEDALRIRMLREGAQDYLIKPFSVDELCARVGNLLAVKRARDVLQHQLSSQSDDLEQLATECAELLERERHARQTADESSRLKDEFLATVSHELRTPLTSILGWSTILKTRSLKEEERVLALDTIERNAKAQTKIIEELLDVSRIITGKLSLDTMAVELAPVIAHTIDVLRPAIEAKSIQLETELDCSEGVVAGDEGRLRQVVWNLLSNAVKFTGERGAIRVTLECKEPQARIIVSDTGQGISPEFLPYVFDRFRQADSSKTRREGGLGLGLAIVRYLVELHGGAVAVESAGAGQGTTFTISLPLLSVRQKGSTVRNTFSQNLGKWNLSIAR